MQCSTKTRSGMTLLGGAGLGAVLMYLLDPDQGERRRAEAAEAARRAAETTGAALAAGYEVAKEKGAAFGERLGEYGSAGAEAASSWTSRLAERAGDTGHSLGKTSRSYAHSARESLPSMPSMSSIGSPRSWFGREEQRSYVPSGSSTLTAVACLAAGFGLMYLMDPQQGRRRRHVARDKTMKWLREIGDMSRKTGRHWANKSRGYAHEARSAAAGLTGGMLGGEPGSGQSLAGRIRAKISSLRGGQNVNVDCDDCGRVTLGGDCAPEDATILLAEVRSVPGVDSIDNRLNVRDNVGSTTGTGPGLGQ
jgi:hypothetical protein